MYKSKEAFSNNIGEIAAKARVAKASLRHAKTAMACLDLTSLNDGDTNQTVRRLCQKARRMNDYHPAAVCIWPEFLAAARGYLDGTDIGLATVINFPYGSKTNGGEIATPENTTEAITDAIANGATEIDIVLDYQSWKMDMDDANTRALLRAARTACGSNIKLKAILETAAIDFEPDIYDLSVLAIEEGVDMIKTSTGRHEDGGAQLSDAAPMLLAIRDHNPSCGIKISGGLKTVRQCAQYIELAEHIMGRDYVTHQTFRFGASEVYDDLQLTIETNGQIKGRTHERPVSPATC